MQEQRNEEKETEIEQGNEETKILPAGIEELVNEWDLPSIETVVEDAYWESQPPMHIILRTGPRKTKQCWCCIIQ